MSKWSKAEDDIAKKYTIKGTQVIVEELRRAGYIRTVYAVQSRLGKGLGLRFGQGGQQRDHDIPIEYRRILLQLTKDKRCTLTDLANRLDISPRQVQTIIEKMGVAGYQIDVQQEQVELERNPPGKVYHHAHAFKGKTYRFGVLSDTHLCSRHADEDGLNQAYEVFRREGITVVYHCGNIAEGQHGYPGQENELLAFGAHRQAQYVVERYPKVDSITTWFIGSSTCHEGGFYKYEGLEFGRMQEIAERGDLKYLGLDESDIALQGDKGTATMRLFHPGGGSAYALSYRPQKIVESLEGGEKPHILCIGHFHKMEYLPSLRNIHTIQAGCLEHQTAFARKRNIEFHRGFWLVEATIEADGSVTRLKAEAFRFYNNPSYRVGPETAQERRKKT